MATGSENSSDSMENVAVGNANEKEIAEDKDDGGETSKQLGNSGNQEASTNSNGPATTGDKSDRPLPQSQPTKRRPDKELNHDNWDQEDEPEEQGEFKKASDEQLKDRKILTAKRKQKPTEASNNPFAFLNLPSEPGNNGAPSFSFNFSSTSTPAVSSLSSFDFSWPGLNKDKTEESKGSSPPGSKSQSETVAIEKKCPMDNGSGSSTVKTAPAPTKRRPGTDLNHENWDQEEVPEEKGEFTKATEDQLKDRKILTAKRKQKTSGDNSNNPFGSLSLASAFGTPNSTGTGSPASLFNFTAPASTPIPSFDFSSTSATANEGSSDKKDEKDD
ncbi:unnamed protein product [Orchesella dallaii]|uniref:Nuclear pore complex NUP2/50/61 domain-containing protein n=1 Tax=Orchesella dallaii TaxID=48710 RepID=A0ABP1QFJ5_9HEXA